MDRLPVPVMAPRATPAVSFSFDRRPETATQVRLEVFEGPLALLLSLIEQRQLDVLTVRLGDLAAAYLEALALLPGDRLPHLSTFVGVASQLILIKSRALLPRSPAPAETAAEEGPDPEEELRRRLVLYRVYRDAGLALRARLESGMALFHREPVAAYAAGLAGARPAGARPADEAPLDPALLAAALVRTAQLAPPPAPPSELVARTITLAECAEAIRAALRGAPLVVLQELVAGMRDRVLVAVTFLAMLELVKRRELMVEQDAPWGPIRCRATTTAERVAAGVAAGVAADAPIDETLADFA
jgi:segregation and condensation protein A